MHDSDRMCAPGYKRFQDAFDTIVASVRRERLRQNMKFAKGLYGIQFNGIFKWLTILGEEKGESDEAALDIDSGKDTIRHLREELVQTAAVCFAIIERIDANGEELFK